MSILALALVKMSFLFFYRRIFCPNKRSVSAKLILFGICIVGAWSIAFFFGFFFACKGHFAAWWGSVIDLTTKCVKTFTMLYALAISDFLTDAFTILLPLPLVSSDCISRGYSHFELICRKIWQLQLPTSRKLLVTAIFLLGAV